ncbi:MAG: hypothetical protein J7501_06075 [Bdellovibrio sp.]|nr:hypothetical protein [Bdellovibrio sp.]
MKKKIMLALAFIMVLGSVKAMAATAVEADDNCDECMMENTLGKIAAAEEDMQLVTIRAQIVHLKENTLASDSVRLATGEKLSAGQLITIAEQQYNSLNQRFDDKKAAQLNKELASAIKSLK